MYEKNMTSVALAKPNVNWVACIIIREVPKIRMRRVASLPSEPVMRIGLYCTGSEKRPQSTTETKYA